MFQFQTPPGEGAFGHVRASPEDLVLQTETDPDKDRRTDQRPRPDSDRNEKRIDKSSRNECLGHDRQEKLLQHRVYYVANKVSWFVLLLEFKYSIIVNYIHIQTRNEVEKVFNLIIVKTI